MKAILRVLRSRIPRETLSPVPRPAIRTREPVFPVPRPQTTTLSKTGSLMTISYTGVTYDQAEAYRTMVVKSGFSENTSEMATEETIMFYADDADGRFNVGVGFSDGKLVIMILKY